MGLFSKRNIENVEGVEKKRGLIDDIFNPLLGFLRLTSYNNYNNSESTALKLSAVYRAVNVISDSIAVLPINIYQYKDNWKYKQYNNLYYLLNVQPNRFMSSYTWKKISVQQMLLNGNSYSLIKRDKDGSPIEIVLLDQSKVEVKISNNTISYLYNKKIVYDYDDIIHFMNFTLNGYTGISTLNYASLTLSTAMASEQHANNFFSLGGSMSGILTPKAGTLMNDAKAQKAKEAFISSLSNEIGVQGGNSNSIVVLDSGLEYQPITVNPKDAQLLESRLFNIINIAQFFGVSPHKLFDYSKGSYNSVEASQIDFLNTTIQPILEKLEIEMYRKIYTRIEYDFTELKFDVSNLLRMDATTLADYLTKMHNIGGVTTNEVREKIDAPYPVTGGNRAFIQVNLQPIDNLISEQVVQPNQIDNKLK